MVLDNVDNEKILDIKKYILENFIPARLVDNYIDVTFQKNFVEVSENSHGQEKCGNIHWPFAKTSLKKVPIKKYNILVPPDNRYNKKIIEFVFDVQGIDDFEWQPGDTIGILPNNSEIEVNTLLDILNLESKADQVCHFCISSTCTKRGAKVPTHIPEKSTPREILRDCINLRGVLKKQFIRVLAEFCSNDEEKLFMKCLSSKEGSIFYNELILNKNFNLLDILRQCKSCQPTLNILVQHLPKLMARYYSIASSPLISKNQFTIVISILLKNTGITTEMLNNKILNGNSEVLMFMREPNNFRYTFEDLHYNQILIAVGTAVAPYIGFLQHKCQILQNVSIDKCIGQTWLFLGSVDKDTILYRKELLQWNQTDNILNRFIECYSRVSNAKFHYVQDAIIAYSSDIVELLCQTDTSLYVCADGAEISKSIENSIKQCLTNELNIDNNVANELLESFYTNGKYRKDIWI